MHLAVFFDSENHLIEQYDVNEFPTAFLIDNDGKIRWKGDPRGDEVDEFLEMHLPEAPLP